MHEPQEGIWTLTAPDGRQWTGASGLRAAAAEQRERIPPAVQLERIFAEMEPTEDEKDAARYRWLRERPLDPHFMDGWYVVQVISDGEREVTKSRNLADLDAAIDAAMLKTANA